MRKSAFLGLLVATTSLLAFAQQRPAEQNARIQPLNIKTGLWETTYVRNTNGEMPIPAEYLSRLSPEQRARLEARMKANASPRTATRTYKSCVKKEDIDGSLLNSKDQQECQITILKSTSTEVNGKMTCAMEGMRGDGTMDMQVIDSGHTKGTSHVTATGNGHTFNSDATMTSKWISTDCGGVH